MKKKSASKRKTLVPPTGISEQEINRREALRQMAVKSFGAIASLYGISTLFNSNSASAQSLTPSSASPSSSGGDRGAYYNIYYYGSYYNTYYYGSYYNTYYYGSYYNTYYYGSYYNTYYYGSYYNTYYYGSYYNTYYYGSYYNLYYYGGTYYNVYYYGSYYNLYYYGSYYNTYYYGGSYYNTYYYYYGQSVIELNKTGQSIKLYPDPVSNISLFDLKGLTDLALEKLEIINLNGQVVKSINIIGKEKVYIYRSDFKSGMHVYRIISKSGKIYSDRFIVQ